MSLLSVDLGSSSCKVVVFSACGDILGEASSEYQAGTAQSPFAELPVESFWTAFCEATRAACASVNGDPVQALCIGSHGETFVPVNDRNEPLGPAILNIDHRAVRQAEWLTRQIGTERIFQIAGAVMHAGFPAPKLRWLAENQPEIFGAARRFATLPDWILARLGCAPYIDYSLAARFLAFDIRRQKWSDEILSAVGMRADRLPEPAPAGTVAGRISSAAAVETGIPPGALAVVGGHDQPNAALGMGVHKRGMVSDSLGTFECLLACDSEPSLAAAAFEASLTSYSHVVPGQYISIAYFPSGIMVRWLGELLYGGREPDYRELERQAPAGPSGLLVTPHLIGSCNPDFDARATAAIVGLTPSANRGAIYKGVLEGVACEMTRMTQFLKAAVGPFSTIHVTGGGTRSRLGLELRAALSGCRLRTLQVREAACLGAAILAGVAAGVYRDHVEAIERVVKVQETIEPDAALATQYEGHLDAWKLLYRSLAPIRGDTRDAVTARA